jgi:hypothetical protein
MPRYRLVEHFLTKSTAEFKTCEISGLEHFHSLYSRVFAWNKLILVFKPEAWEPVAGGEVLSFGEGRNHRKR